MKSNLIPITRIYDIYPKYTYSNDVKKFMDEIVDIDRANVFTEADMMNTLDKIFIIATLILSVQREIRRLRDENRANTKR